MAQRRELEAKIEASLNKSSQRGALYRAMKRGRDSRKTKVSQIRGGDSFRKEVREIKERCLEAQDVLVDRFAEKARERGAKVFLAEDGPAAIGYILNLAKAKGATHLAKSKSLTSEEISVNHPLEEAGIQVIETDLGELIIQRVHEKPFHLVFPAVHKTAEEVAEIFQEDADGPLEADVDDIMAVVRRYLRPIFLNADIGMTGANVGIAENGGIVIETNEGNARLVSSLPDVHICIMGREKVVETIDDALMMMMAHPVSAVGQHLTTYVTMMAGRSPAAADGPDRETHLVILDNGRTRMQQDPLFKDALNCIRCGACMNICPTYGVVGGHTFGHIYPGPIGIPWTAEVHGLKEAGDFAHLCISCGLCKEICPAEIDIPMMIAAVKDKDAQERGRPRVDRLMMDAERMAQFGCATAPVSNWLMKRPAFRWVMEKTVGVDRRRDLPAFSRVPLNKRLVHEPPPTAGDRCRVAFFADLYATYNNPERGLKAIGQLEAAGCQVVWPEQEGCGYPAIGYGDLTRARDIATRNVNRLAPYAEAGCLIVTPEPTAAYCLRVAYPKLLKEVSPSLAQAAASVARQTRGFFDLLNEMEETDPVQTLSGRRFGFHLPCHERPLSDGDAVIQYLKRRGAEVTLVETGTCCGMGGTFGMKAGMLGYELSQAVGEPLFQAFSEADVEGIVTESSVCSIHLAEGTGLPLFHPLELVGEPSISTAGDGIA